MQRALILMKNMTACCACASWLELGLCQVLTELFESPPRPVRLEMPARVTRLAICLQAMAMLLRTVASSPSMVPFCSSCGARRSMHERFIAPPHTGCMQASSDKPGMHDDRH